jgi:putative ATP-dependent endonuclease of the OLD family
MARICRLEIQNFRSIKSLDWFPSRGINCLVGPGDSGKSTILDAIDYCLGARRNIGFGDADFYGLDVSEPITISATLDDLPDELLNLEAYATFLRGFDPELGLVEDEPKAELRTVLTLRMTVASDLEPVWSLFSERAEADGLERGLAWKDRSAIAPARIGNYASNHLTWTRGSVLNRLTEDRADLGEELAKAAREARSKFGDQAERQLGSTLEAVTKVAHSLGVPVGESARALLDAHSVSIGDGAIGLHDDKGVPLKSLGTGSGRLLIAGLQREAAEAASIVLVDEVEYGLEPHRLVRLLDSLGAKDAAQPLQVFMTSHSPVAVRELSGDQVCVVRAGSGCHLVLKVGTDNDIQSTLRADPEAFLARSVMVCEGASEVGFARGLDLFWTDSGAQSFLALGGAYVNVGGGDADKCYRRGIALLSLGYRVLVLADADKPPTPAVVAEFVAAGGKVISWRAGRALEDELFSCLPDALVMDLIDYAGTLVGEDIIASHVQSKSDNKVTVAAIRESYRNGGIAAHSREVLAAASRIRSSGWFKSLTAFQLIGNEIVGPELAATEAGFNALIEELKTWTHAA